MRVWDVAVPGRSCRRWGSSSSGSSSSRCLAQPLIPSKTFLLSQGAAVPPGALCGVRPEGAGEQHGLQPARHSTGILRRHRRSVRRALPPLCFCDILRMYDHNVGGGVILGSHSSGRSVGVTQVTWRSHMNRFPLLNYEPLSSSQLRAGQVVHALQRGDRCGAARCSAVGDNPPLFRLNRFPFLNCVFVGVGRSHGRWAAAHVAAA